MCVCVRACLRACVRACVRVLFFVVVGVVFLEREPAKAFMPGTLDSFLTQPFHEEARHKNLPNCLFRA